MKKPMEIIEQLSPQDALAILEILANSDDQLAKRIAEVAMEHLREVNTEDISADVYYELEFLAVEDVWEKAGPSRDGYQGTDEVADEMIDDVLQPYREELSRYQKLNMLEEATYVCMGIIAGLYQFDQESASEFKNWAVDLPASYARDTLGKWYTKRVSPEAVDEMMSFIKNELPNWESLHQLLKRKPSTGS